MTQKETHSSWFARRLAVVLSVFALAPLALVGGTTYYYAKLQTSLGTSSSGMGTVYAGDSSTEGTYGNTSTSAAKSTTTSGGNVASFYARAKANDNYEFSYWSSDSAGKTSVSTENPYTATLAAATSGGEENAKTTTYYANFTAKPKAYYGKLTVKASSSPSGAGAVNASTTSTPGTYSSESSATKSSTTSGGEVTLYASASANEGYRFLHWASSDGGTAVSAANPYTVKVKAATTSGGTSTTTLYAVFEKEQEVIVGTHELNSHAVKSQGALKVSSNTTVSEAAKAFDGNTSTYFAPADAANSAGVSWTGIEFENAVIVSRIDFVGRTGYVQRMVGGAFQGANQADFSDAENILAIEKYTGGTSENVLEEAKGPYRYLRYIGMHGGNVSEITFYGLTAADGGSPTAPVVTECGSDDHVAWLSVRGDDAVMQVYRVQRAMADFCDDDDYETFVTLTPKLGETVTWRDNRKTDYSKYRIQSFNANGTSAWMYFEITPEKLIAGGPVKPTFSGDKPGFYDTSATVTIEYPVEGATIYYTTDGSTPTMNSTRYTGPITLTDVCSRANNLALIETNPVDKLKAKNHGDDYGWKAPSGDQPDVNVIRARAFLADGSASPQDAAGTWLVGPTVNQHQLRVISIQTDRDNYFSDATGIMVPGDVYKAKGFGSHEVGRPNANYFEEGILWERPTQVQIFETNRTELISLKMGTRVRGCWSRASAKKSLTCFARKEYGTKNIKAALFGDEGKMKFKRFLLRNGGNDWYRLGFRDAVAQSMFRGLVNTDTQGYEPAVLYVNGEYWGIYNMRHGYCKQHFEEWNGSDGDVDYAKLDHESGAHFELEEGDLIALWNTHQSLSAWAKSGTTMSDADFAKVEAQIDIDDLIDSHIIHIFLADIDWLSGGNNQGYWRNRNGDDRRWHFVVYDTDIGMSFWNDTYGDDYIAKTLGANVTDDTQTKMAPNFFTACWRNQGFRRRFANRYADLLNTALTTERTAAIIEREVARIEHERARNMARWTNMSTSGGWDTNLARFKKFFANRTANEFANMCNSKKSDRPSSGSLVTLTLQATEGVGSVKLNSIESGRHFALPFTGQYFSDIPVTLTATPKRGYRFTRWRQGGSVVSTEPTCSLTITASAIVTAEFEKLPPGADIIEGDYPNGLAVELTESTVLKIGDATFGAPLTVRGADVTLQLLDGTTATLPQIDATNCCVTVDGTGALELSGTSMLLSCAGLVVSNGTLKMEFAGKTSKAGAVILTKSYLQYGGDVTMNLKSSKQVYGFYSDTKDVLAQIHGGTFATTVDGGEKSATFKMNKGSNDVLLKGGKITVNLAGTAPRFVNTDGKLEIAGSEIKVETLRGTDGTTALGSDARVFKSVKKQTISGGVVTGTAACTGSEMFSSDNKIEVSGGVVSVVTADDCFSATTNITVKGGKVHALSAAGDALDSNGDMVISGGYVFAFALSEGCEGLDVDPGKSETGLNHTLVISGGTVVSVGYGGEMHAPDVGSVDCYTCKSMRSDLKYVEIEDCDGRKSVITTVNWKDRHADTFSLIATCPDFTGMVKTTNTKPNKDLPNVEKLDEAIDGVFLTHKELSPFLFLLCQTDD